jgi:hypothetical protein
MASLTKRKLKPDEIVVAIESFAGSDIRVPAGMRLRGDNPIVRRVPHFFTRDGASAEELTRLRQELIRDSEPPIPVEPSRTRIAREVRDEDAVVYVRGIMAGTRVHRKSKAASTAPPGTTVPVMPDPTLDRRDALVATETLRIVGENGKTARVLYAGQLVQRDDELVQIHPHSFVLPQIQDREV